MCKLNSAAAVPLPNPNKAICNLSGNVLIGLVEHYTDSMALVEQVLRRWYPNCDLTGLQENVTRQRSNVASDIREMLLEFGRQMAHQLLSINGADIALYDHAASILASSASDAHVAETIRKFRYRQHGPHDNYPPHYGQCPSQAIAHELLSAKSLETQPDRPAMCSAYQENLSNEDYRSQEWGNADSPGLSETVRILALHIGGNGQPGCLLLKPRDKVRFELKVEWLRSVTQPIVGLTIRDRRGRVVWCISTLWTNQTLQPITHPEIRIYTFASELPSLVGGLYTVDADTATSTGGFIQMLASSKMAMAFGVEAATDPVPGGFVFVPNIELLIT